MTARVQWGVYGLAIWGSLSLLSFCTHTNPPVDHSVAWDSPQTQHLFKIKCMDCHSNETRWPLYSYIAPMSLIMDLQVYQGRSNFNVSTEVEPQRNVLNSRFEKGWMENHLIYSEPLSVEEKDRLVEGLRSTFLRLD